MLPQRTPIHFPLAQGLDSKTHPFALDMPRLSIAENLHFFEPGSLTKRWGHKEQGAGRGITITKLTSGKGTSAASFVTGSFTMKPGKLYIAWIHRIGLGTAGASISGWAGVPGGGIEYKTTGVGDPETGVTRYTVVALCNTTSVKTTGTVTISFSGSTQNSVQWSIEEVDGAVSDVTDGTSAFAQAVTGSGDDVLSKSVTLAAFQDVLCSVSTSAVTVGFGRDTGSGTFTPESGYVKLGDEIQSSGTLSQLQTMKAEDVDDLTPSASWSVTSDVGMVALEIKAAKGGTEIETGGHVKTVKGMARRGRELIVVATTTHSSDSPKLLAWSKGIGKWIDRGHYEGVEMTQTPVVHKTTDQLFADRARYASGDTVVDLYAWEDSDTGRVRYQILDGATGQAITEEKEVSGTSKRPRCMRVNDKLHLYVMVGVDFYVKIFDPLDVNGTVSDAAVALDTGLVDTNTPYDVCGRFSLGTDYPFEAIVVYRLANAPQTYTISRVDSAGSVLGTSVDKLREAAGGFPISVCYEVNTDKILVVRMDNTAVPALVKGDILDGTSLADQAGDVNVTILTTDGNDSGPWHFAAAFQETANIGSSFRKAHVFISNLRTIGSVNAKVVRNKTMDTDGAVAGPTQGPSGSTYWQVHATLATRAFARGQWVYVTTAHVQNAGTTGGFNGAYVVTRHDGLPIARTLWFTGSRTNYNDTEISYEFLPNVEEEYGTDKWRFAGTYATRIGTVADGSNRLLFGDHGIMDVTLDFTSSRPYRGVELGKTLYFPGGYLAQYDGVGVSEVNFFSVPNINAWGAPTAGTAAGAALNDNSDYYYKAYYEWRNGQGELERSAYIGTRKVTTGAGGGSANDSNVTWPAILTFAHTLKSDELNSDFPGRGHVVIALYRTEANGSQFYRITSLDPADTTGDNRFLFNDPTAGALSSFVDSMPDSTLVKQQADPANAQELYNLPPDGCHVIASGQSRLFVSDGKRVFYSKLWNTDDVAAFHPTLEIKVPQEGGDIVAIHAEDSYLVLFRESRTYLVAGKGAPNVPDLTGYEEPQLISADTGCSDQRTVVHGPQGLFFKSPKGWRLLIGTSMQDVGAPVADYDSQTFVAAILLKKENGIVCVASSGKSLLWDYSLNQWATWTQPIGVAAVQWEDGYACSSGPDIFVDNRALKTDVRSTFTYKARTPWIYPFGRNGRGMVWEFEILGEYMGPHALRTRVYYDDVETAVDSMLWTVDTARYNLLQRLSQKKLKSFMVEMSDEQTSCPMADSVKLTALSVIVGDLGGLTRQPSSRSQ